MALATLPYPSMDFTPLDVLTADELDQIVANIDAVNNATVGTTSIATGAITTAKVADGNITTVKVADDAITNAKIDFSTITSSDLSNIAPTSATATDYISFSVGTVNSLTATKIGRIVKLDFDVNGVNVVNGQKTIGSCTDKIMQTSYGAGRSGGGTATLPVSFTAIPSGELRVMATGSNPNIAGTIWVISTV